MTTEAKPKYALFILKRDNDHISVLESENFDEVYALWKETKDQWTTCIKEAKPFELTKPLITAFDPTLIYEVTVRPMLAATSRSDNPYAQKMHREGFSSAFGSQGNMLDGGFKL